MFSVKELKRIKLIKIKRIEKKLEEPKSSF